MLFNNSGGARISISYSIFDVPTHRLQTVSFQLAPLLLTKAGQTPARGPGPCRSACTGLLYSLLLVGCTGPRPHPCPPPPSALSTIVLTVSSYLGSSDFPRPEVTARLHFQASSDLLANWLRCKPSQQARDFEVAVLCRAPGTSPSVCQIAAARACCSAANRNSSSHHVVLQGSSPCCYFIAGLSLILQAGPGMQSDPCLIRGCACARVCKPHGGTPAVPPSHREPPLL